VSGLSVSTAQLQADMAALPIQNEYISSEQAIVTGGLVTLAHGLGEMPRIVKSRLICKTADKGYSVGDEVVINTAGDLTTESRGLSVTVDSTNISLRFGSNASCFQVTEKSTGSIVTITNSRWKLIIEAWS
jgi:hypothetical protein